MKIKKIISLIIIITMLSMLFSIPAYAIDPFTFDYDNQTVDVAFADLLAVLFMLLHGAGAFVSILSIFHFTIGVSDEDPSRNKHISTFFLGMILMSGSHILTAIGIFI